MTKIKVLHIIKSLGRGGAEMLLPETLQLHDQVNFEFHYIYFLPWKDQMVEGIQEEGGRVTCLEATNNIQLILKYSEVILYCRKHGIDLIHCHLPWAGFLGRLVFFKTGIPVLYTEHNMQERYHWITRFINKMTFDFQTLAFGVSADVTRSISGNIHPHIQVRTLLNGVNSRRFIRKGDFDVRRQLGIPAHAIVIGNVAVFRTQKRLLDWLRVLKELTAEDPRVYGILVGAGPLEASVKMQLKQLELEQRVFLPGLQTDVKPFFEAMDIFMMSSRFEGLPIALLEAMSMECAVVATDAGGIKEVIRKEIDGLTCGVENWRELADLCRQLIKNPSELDRCRKAARKRVISDFSLERMVGELETCYFQFARLEKLHVVV